MSVIISVYYRSGEQAAYNLCDIRRTFCGDVRNLGSLLLAIMVDTNLLKNQAKYIDEKIRMANIDRCEDKHRPGPKLIWRVMDNVGYTTSFPPSHSTPPAYNMFNESLLISHLLTVDSISNITFTQDTQTPIKNKRSHAYRSHPEMCRWLFNGSFVNYCIDKGELPRSKAMTSTGRCKKKCFPRISEMQRITIFSLFWDLESKNVQDIHLQNHITMEDVKRRTSKDEDGNTSDKRSVSFRYYVKLSGSLIEVCKVAFCNIYGVTPDRVRRL
ncbi:hypothetical protein C0J52_04003 [Blattella germanica]|nr:hypothetical protein C0J52_04003 [Blattella germanica]